MALLEHDLGPDQPAEGEFRVSADELAEMREAMPNANHWVWVLGADGAPIAAEPPNGPYDLDNAKTYARIAATEGKHNRVVTRGRDPRAAGFEILREYAAGTGEHIVKR